MTTIPQFNASSQVGADYVKPFPQVKYEAQVFAQRANGLADQILSQNAPAVYQGPVIVRTHHYYSPLTDWYYSPFYSPRVVVINNSDNCAPRTCTSGTSFFSSSTSDRKNDKKAKDEAAAVVVAAVAAGVGLVGLYFLGTTIASLKDTRDQLNETNEFRETILPYSQTQDDKEGAIVYPSLDAIALKDRICTRIQNSALVDLVLRTGLVASCGAAIAGAVTTTPAWVTAGAVAGLASTTGIIFKWGFESQAANIRDAHELKNAVNMISNVQ